MQYRSTGLYADERDGFISWLRGEFAAANAIIDSLCNHLKSVGEGGEYDDVVGSIQQRRCNWSPVLHMQQYFSVAEVVHALQQVTWRKSQRPVKAAGPTGKECKRSGGGFGGSKLLLKSEILKCDAKDVNIVKCSNGLGAKLQVESIPKSVDLKSTVSSNSECNPNLKVCSDVHLKHDSSSTRITHLKPNVSAAKTFVGSEMMDGKQINAVEGMKMYEDLFDDSEVGKMVCLVNDLRVSGRQRKFQGQTYVVSRRPMKGHGREMIQLGLPIADAPFEDEAISITSKDRRIEPIPSLFEDVIERLMAMQILAVKPDSCIIDIFNEGDHSQPHSWPHWFGRPICLLFLTDGDITFGRVIGADHPGDYRGSIKLSLKPGSMLVMEGRSTDFAKHAIPSIRKQRILVTFTKSQPSHWAPPPPTTPQNQIHHPTAVPPNHPHLQPSNGIQPIFIPAAVALPPASGGWAAAPLMQHASPRLPVPGTGVFLPPGGKSSPRKSEPEKVNVEEHCNGNGGGVAAVGDGE